MAEIRIVLVGTQHPGNIGSAVRAMCTMGLRRLDLVAPEVGLPHPEATALAAGADDVLDAARVHRSLEAAVADCALVFGCTARSRTVALPELDPREAARRLLDGAAQGPVAVVFGRERTGLSNDELQLCHAAVRIPSVADFSSLNLAASVQVIAYELRRAAIERNAMATPSPRLARREPLATQAELEAMFSHFAAMLDDIDFHKGRSPSTLLRRLRRLFLRAQPDRRELRILRGILSDMQRAAKLPHREPREDA